MIRLTIRLKKRELDSEFKKLRCALEELKRVVYEEMTQIPGSVLRKMRRAGLRGARAGIKLRKKIKKGGLSDSTSKKTLRN